jgi:cold shock CspA family protein
MMVRRVGLSAEAAEARTLLDCQIWPGCTGRLVSSFHSIEEKGSATCTRPFDGTKGRERTPELTEKEVLLGQWDGEVVRRNGYGYIVPDRGDADSCASRQHRGWRTRTLFEGARVGFDLREGGFGPEAIHVLQQAAKGSP